MTPNPDDWIIGMLRSAADILEKNPGTSRIDSVAWRVADVGLEIRRLVEANGLKEVPGVHQKTGKGAILPDSDRYPIPEEIYAHVASGRNK